MLISLKIKNFRSIREEVFVDFIPSSKKKDEILNNVYISDGISLIKSLVITGRNASGKSNILKAFRAINYFVTNSDKFKHNEKIPCYEPFLFDKNYKTKDVEFEIIFTDQNCIKYKYVIKYSDIKVNQESLFVYPKGTKSLLYERENGKIIYGDYYRGEKKGIEENLLNNQLFLSKSATNDILYLKEAYLFLTAKIVISTFHDSEYDKMLMRSFSELMSEDNITLENVKALLKAADTNIADLRIQKNDASKFRFPTNLPEELKQKFINDFKFQVFSNHPLFENGKKILETSLLFNEESLGTKKLLTVGGLILSVLKNGGVIVIDELDKSLHPHLTRLLISLFHSEKNNPKNAQLIFATHDSSLLDREIFRRDQIYFTDKEYEGNTILYKLSDIKGVRDNIPFDKWYLSGRFASIPVINNIELKF